MAGPTKKMSGAASFKGKESTSVDYTRGPKLMRSGGLGTTSKVYNGADGHGNNVPSGKTATQLRSGGMNK